MKSNQITFHQTGDFQALWAAQQWCVDNGFSYGGLSRNDPVALMRGDVEIAKWKNLTVDERDDIDGKMTSDDFREGPVTVEILR